MGTPFDFFDPRANTGHADLSPEQKANRARLLDAMRSDGRRLREGRDLESLRMVLVTGSPLTEATARWLVDQLGDEVMPQPISGGTDLSYLATSLDDGIAWARERAAQQAGS